MSTLTSKCYRNQTGFKDDTDFVEVLSDGTSIIHTTTGRRNHFAHDFNGCISRGEWVEVSPATRAHAAAGDA